MKESYKSFDELTDDVIGVAGCKGAWNISHKVVRTVRMKKVFQK